MKKVLVIIISFVSITSYVTAQDWEKVTDYMGLDSYCSALPYIGTNDGVVKYTKPYTNEWELAGLKGHHISALYRNSNGITETVLCGTTRGLFFKGEDDVDWFKTDLPDLTVNRIYQTGNYMALTSSGVYKSDDGKSWTLYALNGKDVKRYIKPGVNNIIGFLCHDGYYFSEDNGETYLAAKMNEGMWGFSDAMTYASNYGGYRYYMAVSDTGGIYTINRDSLYFKKVASWNRHNNGIEGKAISYFTTDGVDFHVGTDDGYYISSDSGQLFIKQGHLDAHLTSKELVKSQLSTSTLVTTKGGGVYYNGTNKGFSNIQTLQLAPDGSMYVGTNGFGVFQSKDDGLTWESKNTGLGSLDIRDIEFTDAGKMYAATRSGAYFSEDYGLNWSVVKPETSALFSILTDGYPYDGLHDFVSGNQTFYWMGSNFNWNGGADNLSNEIYTIALDRKNEKYWAGGKLGLWWSKTDYVGWRKVETIPYHSIYDFDIDSKGRLLALTKADIYYSDNGGESWDTMTWIPKNFKTDLIIDNENNYYVATDGGVYYSIDRGLTWIEMNDGLPGLPYNVKVDCIELDNSGHLWAGTSTTGLYRSISAVTNSLEMGKLDSPQEGIKTFYDVNSGSLIIELETLMPSTFQIEIFSTDGKCIDSRKKNISNSENTISYKLKKPQAGIYILRIRNANISITDKFIVE